MEGFQLLLECILKFVKNRINCFVIFSFQFQFLKISKFICCLGCIDRRVSCLGQRGAFCRVLASHQLAHCGSGQTTRKRSSSWKLDDQRCSGSEQSKAETDTIMNTEWLDEEATKENKKQIDSKILIS